MIAGVDYDTNRVAVCMLEWDDEKGGPDFRTMLYRSKDLDAFTSIPNLTAHVQDMLKDKAPRRLKSIAESVDVWWIEHAFGKGPTDFKLGRVQGAIIAALSTGIGDLLFNEVGPSEWKKGVGLGGNAKKSVYVAELRERIRLRHPGYAETVTEHEIDAWAIATFGRAANLTAIAEQADGSTLRGLSA